MLWKAQYQKSLKKKPLLSDKKGRKKPHLKPLYTSEIGDIVRLSKLPGSFDKETDKKWTDELFTITTRSLNQGIPKYEVKDFGNDPIIDKFSKDELQKVIVDQNTHYDIEKVLRKRKKKGKTQLLVRWLGWPSKFDSWIDEDQVDDFTK